MTLFPPNIFWIPQIPDGWWMIVVSFTVTIISMFWNPMTCVFTFFLIPMITPYPDISDKTGC
jgi:hypothetical protein